ncbi:MAG: hypothetical protein A3E37_02170 [Candidatus Andersenbacteria bacterium RIFCSPHIGHO2_12_FULL_46_9]|nr:MAG: LexA repressor [Parcubacteria group bacterium GW2011_GWA2_45_14]OGY34610.1 MAG: hypothetical protein A3B76_06510 [Candidatus Andersenbacteria bacterium RIFCSPHIGHO2_02_FULL_46_16]OGY37608.1 MAG: hypothetical protein A3E37_02170 [Candidatus Andersenbacteria bacterium RIFCSPHIGHO2_12_FULL_46_9]OGY37897.1 MAG: hypothetical protein A3I08_01770 [Candidatus Andersenbacteria bacterium RIFCSPLOWO2_02_FULL_46_11]OGY42891.1 MAG: hypothetical protein A3G57_04430 [Candidatus Andersenbacteria bacter
MLTYPVCGVVYAGWPGGVGLARRGGSNVGSNSWPSPAEEELTDTLSFDEWLEVDQAAHVMAKVPSDDLKQDGILRGDVVIVDQGKRPSLGDVVVAQSVNGLLVRNWAQFLPREGARVIGVVTAVIRKY